MNSCSVSCYIPYRVFSFFFFFFNDPATTEIYTLSLHDALPIRPQCCWRSGCPTRPPASSGRSQPTRSEEHTSELQSHLKIVCSLLLEKKKKKKKKKKKEKKEKEKERRKRKEKKE